MSPTDALSTGLVIAGGAVLVLAAVGAAWPRTTFVRLHYLSLSGLLGAPVALLGVIVRDPGDWFKLLLVMVLLASTSPVAAAATARAVARGGRERDSGS